MIQVNGLNKYYTYNFPRNNFLHVEGKKLPVIMKNTIKTGENDNTSKLLP